MHVVPTSQPQTCTIVRTILLVRRCHSSMLTIETITIKTKSILILTSIGLHIKYIQYVFVLPYFNIYIYIYIFHFTIQISPPTGSGLLILLTLPECWFVSILIVVCSSSSTKLYLLLQSLLQSCKNKHLSPKT